MITLIIVSTALLVIFIVREEVNEDTAIYTLKSIDTKKYIQLVLVLIYLANAIIVGIEMAIIGFELMIAVEFFLNILIIFGLALNVTIKYIITNDGIKAVTYRNKIAKSYAWNEIEIPVEYQGDEIEFKIPQGKLLRYITGKSKEDNSEIIEFIRERMISSRN